MPTERSESLLWSGSPLQDPILSSRSIGMGVALCALVALMSLLLIVLGLIRPIEDFGLFVLLFCCSLAFGVLLLTQPNRLRRSTKYFVFRTKVVIESRSFLGPFRQEVFNISKGSPFSLMHTFPYDIVVGYRTIRTRYGLSDVPVALENIADGRTVLALLEKLRSEAP